jgi:transposase, IS5 family
MGQLGFFDLSRRYEGLDVKDDPLVAIAAMIPWESLRPKLKASLITGGLRASDVARKSPAGRKPWDEVVIFKALVLQALYNLSDDQAEYQLRDRLSFMRFLGLGLEDAVPDAKTLWLYREALAKAGAVEELFDLFDGFLKDKGYLAMGGQIIDATIVSAPKQHNSREENETIKEGETPQDWKSELAKNRQKDKDARWAKKHERSYFGYKNHIGVDRSGNFPPTTRTRARPETGNPANNNARLVAFSVLPGAANYAGRMRQKSARVEGPAERDRPAH